MPKLLLIEDDKVNIELYQTYLKNSGFDISVCMDGVTGLETMLQEIPDLVILDYMLPEMNGSEVYKQMQKLISVKDIPVILVTALAYPGQVKKAFKGLPSKCILHKPIKFPSLIQLIKELLILQTEN